MKRLLLLAVVFAVSAARAQDAAPVSAPQPLIYDWTPAENPVRFRWGINGAVGAFIPANALDAGASVRFGAQVGHGSGIFVDLGSTYGAGFSLSRGPTGVSGHAGALYFFHVAPMAELDLGRIFFVAAGPLLGFGGWVEAYSSADSTGHATFTALAAGGFMPGLDARAGWTLGPSEASGRHQGFTLGVDLKVVNAAAVGTRETADVSGHFTSVAVKERVWGVTPMLMLGYDLR